jgi:hypothetical protein
MQKWLFTFQGDGGMFLEFSFTIEQNVQRQMVKHY